MRVRKRKLFGHCFAIVMFLVPALAIGTINASSQTNRGARSTVPELVPTTVVKASFGASNTAFGFDDLRDNGGHRINLVPCFAIGEQGIFLFDGLKSDIKVYSHDGTHLRTVSVRRSSGNRELNVRATDMAVAAGKIYVLTDLRAKYKDPDRTRFRMLVFDTFSGEQLEELMIPSVDLGTSLEMISGEEVRLMVGGSVTVERFGDDIILYDHHHQFGFPLARAGKSLEPPQRASVTGQGLADRRLRQDKQRSTIQLLSQKTASDLMWGALYTVSRDSRHFLALTHDEGTSRRRVSLRFFEGQEIGYFRPPVRDWDKFIRPSAYMYYELYQAFGSNEPSVFELFVGKDEVAVVRWGSAECVE